MKNFGRFSRVWQMLFLVLLVAWFNVAAYADMKTSKQRVLQETNVTRLKQNGQKWAEEHRSEKARAMTVAKQKGWVIRHDDPDGKTIELQRLDKFGKPVYYLTNNLNAARTISTDKLWPGGSSGLSLAGNGMIVGEWDGGGVRATHQEFGGRVTQKDSPSYANHYHATHVAGTLIATGIDPNAKGMAFQASLHAYDWNADTSEMATAASDDLLLISNHSYGFITGWDKDETDWYWYGNPSISEDEDYNFGFYGYWTKQWDTIAYDAPYYLIVKSAGNDRNDECPDPTAGHYVWDSGVGDWIWSTYNRVNRDGGASGYDTISTEGNAKNILTVGAVNDISGGYGSPSDVSITSFSSWGPCDDGRIKPDICGNGSSLKSTYKNSDTDYAWMSGTSMSAPNVTGSLALLQQHHFNLNTAYMRSATLKALVIHTADEAGPADGPDYMHGWGLMNTAQAADVITENGASTLMREEILNNNDTFTIHVTASSVSPLKATIVWTDPPGAPPSTSLDPSDAMLVNDLDLRITKGATTYLPWILNSGNPSAAATKGDNSRDNVEKIEIDSPSVDVYTITVTHKGELQDGSQAFSLIISGVTQQAKASMISPTPESTFASTTVTFNWTNSGAEQYWLSVGTSPGASDLYNGDQGNGVSCTVSDLPQDGSTVYVRLISLVSGNWLYYDYTYTACNPPDLIVQSPGVSDSTLITNQSFTVYAVVKNQGTGESPGTTLRYYRSPDATISPSDTEIGTDSVDALASEATSGEFDPQSAPSIAGTYWIGACVDTVNGELETGNNCSAGVQITVASPPDLIVNPINVIPTELTSGQGFTVYATVKNQGEGDAPGATLRYYRSTDSTITPSDTEIGADDVESLGSDASSSQSEAGSAPITAGSYWIGACIDAVNGESNTDNNCSVGVQITVGNPPDLVVQSPSVSDATLITGQNYIAYATVKNQGTGVSSSTTLRYYRSTDATISDADTQIGSDGVDALYPDNSSSEYDPQSAPNSAGTYWIGACVDGINGESDTGNNCSVGVQITVSDPPDLVVQSPSVSTSTLTVGQSFTASGTVVNQGAGASSATTLRYYLSTDATISVSDSELSTDAVVSLASGAISPQSDPQSAPSTPGEYWIGLCVDAVEGESDVNNNCSSGAPITVIDPKAVMISPAPGSTFDSTDVTFIWNDSGADEYWLAVGASAGADDLYNASQGTATTCMVSGLPDDGGKVYVRLFSRVGSEWLHNDYIYTTVNYNCAGDFKIIPNEGEAKSFGHEVAIYGDYALVGYPSDAVDGVGTGSAFIYYRNGTEWVKQAKLYASDGASGDNFGHSVAIYGDTAVVGALMGDYSGSVYIFVKPDNGWADMTQTAKLTADDVVAGDNFGYSVAISGDTVIVGSRSDDDNGPNSGSAYVFVKPQDGWKDITQTAKLTPIEADLERAFGQSVAIDGDTAIVGSVGSAFIFEKKSGWSDGSTNQTAELRPDEYLSLSSGDVFINGDTAIAGAPNDSEGGYGSGSAYVFVKPHDGWMDMTQTAKLTASDANTEQYFGISVAIGVETIIVGAYGHDFSGTASGAAYVFIKPDSGWNDMTENKKLTGDNVSGKSDFFGISVAIQGDTALVGAIGDILYGSVYVFCVGDYQPGALQFSTTNYSANENSVSATIQVDRVGGSDGAVSVDFATTDGTAEVGYDYTATSGTLTWADGDSSSKTFTVTILDDMRYEYSETVNLSLGNPTGGVILGAPSTAVLTIRDYEPGVLMADYMTDEALENENGFHLDIMRFDGSSGAVSVQYATSDESATAGEDYVSTSGVLQWADGESNTKSIFIPIQDDDLLEGVETLRLTFSNITGGAYMNPTTFIFTIIDHEPGVLQFSTDAYSVNETDGVATITVTRTNGGDEAVSVQYSTIDGTAVSGTDYATTSGTLSWAIGDTSPKTFDINIHNDSEVEVSETINLTLNNPTGGAALGLLDSAIVTVRDDDAEAMKAVIISPDPASNWASMSSGTPDQINDIWGSSGSDVFAVARNGIILHYDGGAWSPMFSGTSNHLSGIWGSSESDVFAVGYGRTILHYDGIEWAKTTLAIGNSDQFSAVWGSSGSDVFVVAGMGTILHYDGVSWSEMISGTTEALTGIWGSSGSDVFAVGTNGAILHYDGNAWAKMNSGTTSSIVDIWGSSGSDVFAVGPDGAIFHYNGIEWSAMNSGTPFHLQGVWGRSGSDVFAVGYGGTILHYDGVEWSEMISGTTTSLLNVWADSGADVFAVGVGGAILHTNGATLNSTAVSFTWTDPGAEKYQLLVGSSPGAGDYYVGFQGTATSALVTNLPCDGSTIYVRLLSLVGGNWLYNDYTYTACSGAEKAEIQSPEPDSTLDSTTVTFTWNQTGAEQYWLYVGTTFGASDIYYGDQGTNTSCTVAGLPDDASTVHVILWSLVNGYWLYSDYTYTAVSYHCEGDFKITASDGAENDQFYRVGISGDYAIVGAVNNDHSGVINAGAAYIFYRSGVEWIQQAKLTASDPSNSSAFGVSVAISGNTAVVGSMRNNSAYLFVKPLSGWSDMTETVKLTAQDIADGDNFGRSVAIENSTVIVGSNLDDDSGNGSGSAYIFEKGTGWENGSGNQTAKLSASDAAAGKNFGMSVSISGNAAVVGADYDTDNGTESGAAYLFVKSDSGWIDMTQTAKLTASDAAAYDRFGYSLEISDETVIIGSLFNDSSMYNAGAAYVFVKPSEGWKDMNETSKLTASDAYFQDWFGYSVAISDNTAIVGSHYDDDGGSFSGSAYVFVKPNDGWYGPLKETAKLTAQDASAGDYFGLSVAINGGTALVGSHDDDNGEGSGSVYIFCTDDLAPEINLKQGETNIADGDTYSIGSHKVGTLQYIYFTIENIGTGNLYLTTPQFSITGPDADQFDVWSHLPSPIRKNKAISFAVRFSPTSVGAKTATISIGNNDSDENPYDLNITGMAWDKADIVTPAPSTVFTDTTMNFTWLDSFSDRYMLYVGTYPGGSDIYYADQGTGTSAWVGGLPFNGETIYVRLWSLINGVWEYNDYTYTAVSYFCEDDFKITADDAAADDVFGWAVAISGDTAIVGANQDDDGGSETGSAYIFYRSGGQWIQQAKLTASDAGAGDHFGYSVAISGDTAIVGSYKDDDAGSDSGSVYVFVKPAGGWTDMTQTAKLTASDAAGGDYFGYSVAISGDTVAVGRYNDAYPEAVYLFVKPADGWINMNETAKLTASDAEAEDYFGRSVAVSGDTVIVGAFGDDDGGLKSGSAYVFVKPLMGWSDMNQTAKLTAGDAATEDYFGRSVAISGNEVIIGAYGDDDGGSGAGSAYVFVKPAAGWTDMTETAKLNASDAAWGDIFGYSVSINGKYAFIGAYCDDDHGDCSGAAYVFVKPEGGWNDATQMAKIVPDDGAAHDHFGSAVAISGENAIAGAYFDDDDGDISGSAYLFCTGNLAPEINLTQDSDNIADGGSYDFGDHKAGTDTDIVFTIENTGTADLYLTTLPLTITGADAHQFSIQANPASTVWRDDATTFTVRFNPTSAGAKTATLSIGNNDSDENPYDLTVTGTAFCGRADMISPTPYTALIDTTANFQWIDSCADQYWLFVGTSVGGSDLYSADQGSGTSVSVAGLPYNGETVYVRLYSLLNGVWEYNDYTYTAYNYASEWSVITSPTPGSELTSRSVTFTWSSANAEQYWLQIGTTLGGYDLYNIDQGTTLNATVSNLPHNSETLYVRLYQKAFGQWFYDDYIYTAYNDGAAISNWDDGSTLDAGSATFVWNDVGATQYWLSVGASIGAGDIYSASQGTNLSATLSGLPHNGETIYVRLWSFQDGEWVYRDYIYTAVNLAAQITSPADGSDLSSTTVTFEWNNVSASQYYLYVGTTAGGSDLYSASQGTNLSAAVSGLPFHGELIYVRLWSLINNEWLYNDYIYTAYDYMNSHTIMTSPTPGSTLNSTTVTFAWSDSGADQYWLEVGTTQGDSDLYGMDQGTNLSRTVYGLPNNSQTLYVRLWQKAYGVWSYKDYTYTACNQAAVITSPAPDSILDATTVAFTWSNVGANQYWLSVGTSVGANDLYSGDQATNTTATVSGLPHNGATLYVRLYSYMSGAWIFNDYIYTAYNMAAELTSPYPGSHLSTTEIPFRWNDVGASQYYLYVGTTQGGDDIYSQSQGTATSVTISGLPHNGLPLYVRLWSQINGEWLFNDYTFTAYNDGAVIENPPPCSTLDSTIVTFSWDDVDAEQYWLWVALTDGGSDLYTADMGRNTSAVVYGLPDNGETVYVRLWSLMAGEWVYNDTAFTALSD